MALTFFALDKIGNKIAKQKWLPCIVESHELGDVVDYVE